MSKEDLKLKIKKKQKIIIELSGLANTFLRKLKNYEYDEKQTIDEKQLRADVKGLEQGLDTYINNLKEVQYRKMNELKLLIR